MTVAVAGLALAAAPGFAEPVSPRLAEAAADPRTFWDGLQGPLIEYGPTPEAPVSVTFLWRGAAREVELSWPVWTPDRRENHLQHLEGTDIWYKTVSLPPRTRLSYQLAADPVRGAPGDREAYRKGLLAALKPDPLNPARMGGMSLLELAGAPDQSYVARRDNVAAGSLTPATIALDGRGYEVALYRPAVSGQTPLVVLFDAERYLDNIPTPVILDNMIADGVIPPVSAVLIRNADGPARTRDLACNDAFADALAGQLLPWVRTQMAVSDDPANIVLAGSSFGGLMSACAALRHPESFGAVLSQSGSFWWDPAGVTVTEIAGHHVIRQVREGPRQGVRFYLDAGVLEQRAGDELGSIFLTGQTLAEALSEKGYAVEFHPFAGGHDDAVWRGTLSDGLIALLGKRP